MTNPKTNRKDVYSAEEIADMYLKADTYEEYQKLRAKCLVAIFWIFGKRRIEVAQIEILDIEHKDGFVFIRFYVVKKRTHKKLVTSRRKKIEDSNFHAKIIIEYLEYMKEKHPESKYLFPSTKNVFGLRTSFYYDEHLSGSQIWRIIKGLNPRGWVHLFRETKGAQVVRRDEKEKGEASIETIYRVKRTLDLELTSTAFRYIDRYGTQKVEAEEG